MLLRRSLFWAIRFPCLYGYHWPLLWLVTPRTLIISFFSIMLLWHANCSMHVQTHLHAFIAYKCCHISHAFACIYGFMFAANFVNFSKLDGLSLESSCISVTLHVTSGLGVSMASLTELSFNWTGFISAMISNIAFTYRSIYSKKAMVRSFRNCHPSS